MEQNSEHRGVEKRDAGEVHDDGGGRFVDHLDEPVLELFGDAHVSLAVNREHHRLHSADMLVLVDAEVLDSCSVRVNVHDGARALPLP